MRCWIASLTLLAACSYDGSSPGFRPPCAEPATGGLCTESIETSVDACEKLLACGAIPIANPEDDEDCCFDYDVCTGFFDRLDSHRQSLSLACVEAATCDQLLFAGSPDRPGRGSGQRPSCLQYGDRP